jgi:RNA polymerase sigma-70 factor (ECF subfamily)
VELVLSQQLSKEALTGSPLAWEALIRAHNRRVVLSLVAAGAPLARAKELAHEAWARLVEQQRGGRLERLELPGLAIRQARFLWLDELRARGRAEVRERGAALEAAIDPAPTAEERYLSQDQLARVRRALAELPPSSRAIFLLIYNNPEIPHATAAAQVGLSVQRVRQILCEVRKRLREVLED